MKQEEFRAFFEDLYRKALEEKADDEFDVFRIAPAFCSQCEKCCSRTEEILCRRYNKRPVQIVKAVCAGCAVFHGSQTIVVWDKNASKYIFDFPHQYFLSKEDAIREIKELGKTCVN